MTRPVVLAPLRWAALALALHLPVVAQAAPAAAPAASSTSAAAAGALAPIPEGSAFTATLALRVDDREAALQKAIALTRAHKGWFASLSDDRVSLRVPVGEARALVEELRGQGEVFERSFESQDLRAQRAELESRLKARNTVLGQYMAVLSTASAASVVAVEQEITRVVAEIEGIEGQLRVIDDRAGIARVDVGFVYRDRAAPLRDGTSSFAWLNQMNMADLLGDLQQGRRASRSGCRPTAPEGFAPFRKPGRFQAVSADDVIYRVRAHKNKPKAELAFWREALRQRMIDAGYRLVGEQKIESDGQEGYLIELAGANGPKDQAYLIGLYVRGGRLITVEATGEANEMAAQRAAVVKAMQQLGL